MKTEEFDEAIRKKLESVNQTYTEADIGNVYNHVKQHKGFLPQGFTGPHLLYTILAAAFTGLIIWNVIQMKENRMIETRIDTLQNNLKKVAEQMEPTPNDSSETKETLSMTRNDQEKVAPPEKQNTSSPIAETASVANTPVTTMPDVASTAPTSQISGLPLTSRKLDANFTAIKPISAFSIGTITRVPQIHLAARQVPQLAIVAPSTVKVEKIPSENNVRAKNEQPLAVVEKTKKTPKAPQERIAKTSRQKTEKQGNASTWFTNSEWRAALQVEVTNHRKGIGLTGEWLINQRWSLLAGLRYSKMNPAHFDDRDDYFRDRERSEDPFFNRPHELGDQPRDIDLDSKLLQVPLAIRYYIPLKAGVTSLFFTAGTNLDIVLFQRAQFDRPTDSLLHVHEDISKTTNPDLFNNLFIGAGIQYSRRKWGFQTGLVLSQSLNQTPYKPTGLEYGLNLTLMYRFGR